METRKSQISLLTVLVMIQHLETEAVFPSLKEMTRMQMPRASLNSTQNRRLSATADDGRCETLDRSGPKKKTIPKRNASLSMWVTDSRPESSFRGRKTRRFNPEDSCYLHVSSLYGDNSDAEDPTQAFLTIIVVQAPDTRGQELRVTNSSPLPSHTSTTGFNMSHQALGKPLQNTRGSIEH